MGHSIPHSGSTAYLAIPDNASTIAHTWRKAEHAILVHNYASYDVAKEAAAKFICGAINKIWYHNLRCTQLFYTTMMLWCSCSTSMPTAGVSTPVSSSISPLR